MSKEYSIYYCQGNISHMNSMKITVIALFAVALLLFSARLHPACDDTGRHNPGYDFNSGVFGNG